VDENARLQLDGGAVASTYDACALTLFINHHGGDIGMIYGIPEFTYRIIYRSDQSVPWKVEIAHRKA